MHNRVKFEPEKFQDELRSSAVLLKNIETKKEVDLVVLLFETEQKTGGGLIEKHEYDESSKQLVLYFKEPSVAERVLNFGSVFFKEKTYNPMKYELKGL